MRKITPTNTAQHVEAPPLSAITRDGLPRLVIVETGVAAVDEVGARYTAAHDEHKAAAQELRRLTSRNAPERARAADATAFAEARAAGAPDPGPVNHQRLLRDVAEQTRVVDGLRAFLNNVTAEYVEVVRDNRHRLEQTARTKQTKAATNNAKTIATLLDGLAGQHAANELAAWVAAGPRRPDRTHVAPQVIVNGAKISVPDLVEALSDYVERTSVLDVEEAPARGFHESPDRLDDGSPRKRGRGSFTSTLDSGKGDTPPPAA